MKINLEERNYFTCVILSRNVILRKTVDGLVKKKIKSKYFFRSFWLSLSSRITHMTTVKIESAVLSAQKRKRKTKKNGRYNALIILVHVLMCDKRSLSCILSGLTTMWLPLRGILCLQYFRFNETEKMHMKRSLFKSTVKTIGWNKFELCLPYRQKSQISLIERRLLRSKWTGINTITELYGEFLFKHSQTIIEFNSITRTNTTNATTTLFDFWSRQRKTHESTMTNN